MSERYPNSENNRKTSTKTNFTMQNTEKRQENLSNKFKHFMNTARQKDLINSLHNYHGKNFPITYKPQYKFAQRWQESLQNDLGEEYLLENFHPFYSIICFITVLFNSYAIWALSFQRYFGLNSISSLIPVQDLMLVLKLSQMLFKATMKYQNSEAKQIQVKAILRLVYRELFCFCYFLYLLVLGVNPNNFLEIMVQLIVIYALWKESAQIYQRFKVKGQTINYQNQLKIFDLLINIFVQAHIFAIFLYSASKIHPQSSWTNAIGVSSQAIITQYIYSFYFACTTMLTIGYGDITPKNQAQVMVVVLVQIVGVLSFGYLLNQMGHTLSVMRKKEEELQKDLQTVSKMSKFYNLEKKLEHKAKGFLLANQTSTKSLKPCDENSLLMKLNQELRTQITRQNYLSIVKSSVFFLCNWSKTMQLQIAKRLQKKLVSPNEKLGEMSGPERMYIIKKGKVEVYMNRFGSNSNQKKLLKVMCVNPLLQVTNNLYGYTVAFSNRPVYLQAVACQFTSTYSITKSQFLECITYDSRDFQYFHQLKSKVDQSQFSEEWEAPAIKNNREHYIPSHIFLICRYKKRLNIELNQRRLLNNVRYTRKKFRLINDLRRKVDTKLNGTTIFLSEQTLQFEFADKSTAQQVSDKKVLQRKISDRRINFQTYRQTSLAEYEESAVDEAKPKNIDTVAMEHAKQFLKSMRTVVTFEESSTKQQVNSLFEKQQNYSNYYSKNNLDNVLLKITQENYLERRVNK